MAFTMIAAAGIGSTGTLLFDNPNVTGVSTFGNTVVGGATTELIVSGDARVTGILTIGTSSITLDGSNNQVNVGTGVTIHHSNGVQVGRNTLHSEGLIVNSLNASGVITATSFYGDGTNLTNTGSTLSAASGSQRVVLTGQTSGTMTASATSSNLTFNTSTGALSATSFSGNLTGNVTGNSTGLSGTPNISVETVSGNLNSTGVSTVHTLIHPGQSNPLIVSRAAGTYTIHISDSGNDTTGNGSSGSPYRSLSKAFSMIPDIVNKQAIYIKILGGTYTTPGSVDFYGLSGNGAVYSGQTITIGADSATTFNANHAMGFTDVSYPIQFLNLNFVTASGSSAYGLFMTRCKFLYMRSDCTWTTSSTHGWSYGGGGYFSDTTVDWRANVTATSSAVAGLGALFAFDSCQRVGFSGNVTKSGTKFANHAISVINGTWFESSADITNFNTALCNGQNHYDAETGGYSMLNGFSAINCTTGINLRNGANNRAYSVSYSGNTTNISSTNSWST
jgi:hypothetical protein